MSDANHLGMLLTAYADGSLSEDGCAFIEKQLEERPELREQLGEIRAMQVMLHNGLPSAPAHLEPARREAVLARAAKPVPAPPRWRNLITLAAACVVLALFAGMLLPSVSLVRHQAQRQRLADDEAPPMQVAMAAKPAGVREEAFGFAGGTGGIAPSSLAAAPPPTIVDGLFVGSERDEAKDLKKSLAASDLDVVQTKSESGRIDELRRNGLQGSKGRPLANAPQRPGEPAMQRQLQVAAAKESERANKKDKVANGYGPSSSMAPAPMLLKPRLPPVFTPLPQPMLLAALAERGLGLDARVGGNLADLLNQQWTAPQPMPLRLLAEPNRTGAFTASANYSVGQNLLVAANRNGLQVVPVPGGIEVQPALRPLDPTAGFGLPREEFRAAFGSAPMQAVEDDAQQTFAIDASTSSFDAARQALAAGRLPDPAAIEAQHAYNAVPAGYPPASGEDAFQLYAEAGPAPFARGPLAERTALVALGVVSRQAGADERLPLDLVIALDASGSMGRPGGLDRARAGLAALVPQLDARDRVAVVAFGDVARVVLPAQAGDRHDAIGNAIAGVRPEGSTNLADGLALSCQIAGELVRPGRACRVLLVTDGAALAGDSAPAAEAAVERWRGRGVSLLIVGCAGEAYDGAALERLAQKGDGEHLVAGSDAEARTLFTGRLLPAHLAILARDAKVQVTWNPARVSHARLIGFEKRRLASEQFRDNRVDAGELAQDAQATALFEVVLSEHGGGALGTAAVRYLDTRLDRVVELSRPLPGGLVATVASPRLRLLACAAELAETMQAGWWRNVRGDSHERLASELAHLDAPFARILERMDQRFRDLERQDATP